MRRSLFPINGDEQSRFLESLDEDVELTPEWKTERDRHIQSIENGTAKLISHEELMDNVRVRLKSNVTLHEA